MATDTIGIRFFAVGREEGTDNLEDVLSVIARDGYPERYREANSAPVSAEHIVHENGLWLINFVLARFEGPGRFDPNQPIADFEMEDQERFGEEAAALYDPETNHLLTQYNHRGPKSGHMFTYLSEYIADRGNAFTPSVVLDPDVEAKLQRLTVSRKLHVAIDPTALSGADRRANNALLYSAEAGQSYGANHIELTISIKGDRHSQLRRIPELYSSFKRVFNSSPEAIDRLKYTGKEADDIPMEEVDLLGQQLKENVAGIPINEGRRMDRDARYRALRRIWDQWKPRLNG